MAILDNRSYEARKKAVWNAEVALWIRSPESVKPEEVSGLVNGKQREAQFEGRYAKLGEAGKVTWSLRTSQYRSGKTRLM